MSQYRSTILSNFVAITLTLTGPRLWILIKALIAWIWSRSVDRRRKRPAGGSVNGGLLPTITLSSTHGSRTQSPLHSALQIPWSDADSNNQNDRLRDHNLSTVRGSHSELGAARDMLANTWRELQTGRIRLPIDLGSDEDSWQTKYMSNLRLTYRRIIDFWDKFLQQPTDFAFSILLSVFFITIFVAQSSGGVLSASIVSDTTALAASPKCGIFVQINNGDKRPPTVDRPVTPVSPRTGARPATLADQALAYRKQCYGTEPSAEGCNYFYKQSIPYQTLRDDICPFAGNMCTKRAGRRAPGFTLDTGLIDASFLGINSVKRYQFRRKSTCAPVISEWPYVRKETSHNRTYWMYYNGIGSSHPPDEWTKPGFTSSRSDSHPQIYTYNIKHCETFCTNLFQHRNVIMTQRRHSILWPQA